MEQFNILCVDDEKIVLSALKGNLELNPAYHVYAADSGEEALRMAEDRYFSAYLVDQKMPGIDGVTFVRMLKEIDPNPLVFFLTGQDFDDKAYKASLPDSDIGGAYYFTKPWDKSLFVGLSQALKNRKERQALQKENRKLNHWMAKFFEEASLTRLLDEQPGLDKALDHLYHRLLELKDVEEVEVFLSAGKRLELMRSTIRNNKLPRKELAFVKKVMSEEALMQKAADGWRYFTPLGFKGHKVGMIRLKLTRVDDSILQFIDYIIYQGGVMLNLVLSQVRLHKTLEKLKETQSELIRAEKSSFLTGLSRWLMHSINNILCGIKGDVDLTRIAWKSYLKHNDDANHEALIMQMSHSLPSTEIGIQRLTSLVDDFRFIANCGKNIARRSEFNKLIHASVSNFLSLKQMDQVTVLEKYDRRLEFAKVNSELLIRMIEELLAMILKNSPDQTNRIEISTRKNQDSIEIRISDDSSRLVLSEQQWLKEPIFSSKIPLEASGMGLMIIKEAVLFHQGEIELYSQAKHGSVIRIRLPLNETGSAAND